MAYQETPGYVNQNPQGTLYDMIRKRAEMMRQAKAQGGGNLLAPQQPQQQQQRPPSLTNVGSLQPPMQNPFGAHRGPYGPPVHPAPGPFVDTMPRWQPPPVRPPMQGGGGFWDPTMAPPRDPNFKPPENRLDLSQIIQNLLRGGGMQGGQGGQGGSPGGFEPYSPFGSGWIQDMNGNWHGPHGEIRPHPGSPPSHYDQTRAPSGIPGGQGMTGISQIIQNLLSGGGMQGGQGGQGQTLMDLLRGPTGQLPNSTGKMDYGNIQQNLQNNQGGIGDIFRQMFQGQKPRNQMNFDQDNLGQGAGNLLQQQPRTQYGQSTNPGRNSVSLASRMNTNAGRTKFGGGY